MNAKLYRHVYSESLGCLVVVSDIARSHGEAGVTMGAATRRLTLRPLSLAVALMMGGALHAQTLPTGGAIVGGQGRISSAGSTMTVQQNTAKLAVNWNSFNIGAGNTVVFNQPSSSAVALNSVLGNNPSQIYGSLQSNGQVFLINPSGVLFGKSAQVTVGGLFASILPINTSAFMSGTSRYAFGGAAGAQGEVINQGHLKAVDGGFIVLAGSRVINSGTISATAGTVALASGNSVTLDLDNAGRTTVSVDSATLGALIQNQGLIEADGGQVLLTARGRDMLQASVMNLSGVIQANSIGSKGGQIAIDGGDASQGNSGAVVLTNIAINAFGVNTGERGGAVTITGPAVGLQATTINVSGDAGGGTVWIGGGVRGVGALAHALTTTVDAQTTIDASATDDGDGGTVVLWSEDQTDAEGAVLARGGLLGGNGGYVEMSSEHDLRFDPAQPVDTRAPQGTWGTLLLDPLNIFVVNGTGGSSSSAINALPATVNGTITDGELSTELASSNVVLTATNNISDTATVNVTGAGSLTMNAANVNLAGNYSVGGGLVLNLNGTGSVISGNITGTGGLSITGGQLGINRVQTFTGALTVTNVSDLVFNGAGATNDVSSATVTHSMLTFLNGTFTFGSLLTLDNSTLLDSCYACGDAYVSVNTPVMLVGNNNISIVASQYQQGMTFRDGFTGSGNVTMLENGGYRGLIDVTGNMAGYSGNITASTRNAQPFWIQFNSNNGWGTGTLTVTGGNVSVNYNYNTDFRLPYYGCTSAVNQPTAKLVVNGGTFTTGTNVTIGSLSGVGSGTIDMTNASSTLTTGLLNDSSDLFDGVMTGPGSFAKVGTGTQILTGNNNYTGTTLVSAGTLQVGNNGTTGTLGTGVVTDNANLVFDFSNSQNLSAIASNAAGIAGSGNFTAEIGGNFTVDRTVNLTGPASIITLEAGDAQPAGTATGGDVTFLNPVNVTAGGTVTIFQGDPNTATLNASINGATGSTEYKTYGASVGMVPGAVAGTRNFYYRAQPYLTVGNLTAAKVYDGTNNAMGYVNTSGATLAGQIEGDQLGLTNLSLASANFNTSHAGNNLTLYANYTANPATYSSSGTTWVVSGYGVNAYVNATTANVITQAPVTVTATSATKSYDGTTVSNVPITNITGLVAGDSLNGLTQVYNNSHALGTNGSLLLVDSNGVGVTGSHSSLLSDYAIAYVTNTGTITPASVVVTATPDTKVYDGTTASFQNVTNITGLVSGDSLTGLTEVYASPHVLGTNGSTLVVNSGGIGVSGSAGSTLSDYTIAYATTTGTITQRGLTIDLNNITRAYDGTNVAYAAGGVAESATTTTGLVAGNALTDISGIGIYNSAHVLSANAANFLLANMTISLSGNDLSDYSVSLVQPVSATITRRSLTIDLNNVTKAYDGTNVAFADDGVAETGSGTTGLVTSDAITGITGNGTYNSAHVLSADAASFALANLTIGLSGNDLSDYSVALVQPVGAAITPASVSVTATPETKVYDSTTASDVSITNITGTVQGDSLTGLTQAYTNANVMGPNGSTLVVNASNVGVAGDHASALSDYAISYYTSPGTITPAPVTVSNVTLNGNNTLNISQAVVTGVLPGQTLAVVYGSVSGTVAVAGPDAGNYMVTNPYVTVPPLVYIPNWLGAVHSAQTMTSAVHAARYMAFVLPQERITVTQSPQSPQLLQVADTGQPPTTGPTRIPEAGPSSSNVYCVHGAIRTPSGVQALPIENCGQPRRLGHI